tara:strand:- start:88 stop:426 length:339 start_codon:yes stop_codon:yes gene_type:complete
MPIVYPYKFSDWYGYDKDCSSRSVAYRYAFTVGKPNIECGISRAITTQFWHDGSGITPLTGDTCYTSATGNNYLGNGRYSIRAFSSTSTPFTVITISGGLGVVSSFLYCPIP